LRGFAGWPPEDCCLPPPLPAFLEVGAVVENARAPLLLLVHGTIVMMGVVVAAAVVVVVGSRRPNRMVSGKEGERALSHRREFVNTIVVGSSSLLPRIGEIRC